MQLDLSPRNQRSCGVHNATHPKTETSVASAARLAKHSRRDRPRTDLNGVSEILTREDTPQETSKSSFSLAPRRDKITWSWPMPTAVQPFMFMSLPVGGFSLSLVEGRGRHLPSHLCFHLNGVHSNRHEISSSTHLFPALLCTPNCGHNVPFVSLPVE